MMTFEEVMKTGQEMRIDDMERQRTVIAKHQQAVQNVYDMIADRLAYVKGSIHAAELIEEAEMHHEFKDAVDYDEVYKQKENLQAEEEYLKDLMAKAADDIKDAGEELKAIESTIKEEKRNK